MKNRLFISLGIAIAALWAIAPSSFGQSLKGMLKNINADEITIILKDVPDSLDIQTMDTVPVIDGKFTYNLKIKTPTRIFLSPQYKVTNGRKLTLKDIDHYLEIILVPGEQAILTGTIDKFKLSGSAFYMEYQKAHAPIDIINDKLNALFKKYDILFKSPSEAVWAQVTALSAAKEREILSYIKNHPDSDVSTAFVSELSVKSMDEGVALLTQRARDGRLSPIYKKILRQEQKKREKEECANNLEGKMAPSFSLPGMDGKMISLESFRGKYVVVDFWGLWCGWCIKGIPDMKKYYDKYKDKMEIISVDCHDPEEDWLKAVTNLGLRWTQVHCNDMLCDVPALYHIKGYPTKLIINPQGMVLKIFVGEKPDFYEYLDKLFHL
jgi:thiol-disulfide isomerase/thioredoxin